MRLYVNCQNHPQEKIYVKFQGGEPKEKSDIPITNFRVQCVSTGAYYDYNANNVIAEEGAQLPLAGAGLGALLFLINPISGLIGTIIGLIGGQASETEKVNKFNNSRV